MPSADGLPPPIAPMLATAGALPADDDQWAYEPKWDGMRAVVHLAGDGLVIRSRNLREVTASFPELAAMPDAAATGREVVLDGELVALDDDGRPSFQRLQDRMHRLRPSPQLVERVPVTYVAFDLLFVDGDALLDRPFRTRRQALVGLELTGPSWRVGPSFEGDGAATLESARRLGFEGVVAKRLTSTYQPGRRTREWIKTKVLERCEFVVGGWMPGEGGRSGTVGSLLLGAYDGDRRLRFVGSAGSGLTERDLELFSERLAPLARRDSPFADPVPRRGARFVEPELVVEVEYRQQTDDGFLRQPVYKGLRFDKDPKTVTMPESC